MRIVISDGSYLTDLRNASLLDAFLRLPHEILVANTLWEDGVLMFTRSQRRALIRNGLKIADLPGERVLRVRQVVCAAPQLSIQSGFAFALAESSSGCTLLTDDAHLRALAKAHKIAVRGFLWIIDEIHQNGICTPTILHAALRVLGGDPAVAMRLSQRQLARYLESYRKLSRGVAR
jgi:hypothetical protein